MIASRLSRGSRPFTRALAAVTPFLKRLPRPSGHRDRTGRSPIKEDEVNALSIHTKRLTGLLVATTALAAIAIPSAVGSSGNGFDPTVSGIERQLVPSNLSVVRDRSTGYGYVATPAQQLAQPVSGIERQLMPAWQSGLSVVRDRSTGYGYVATPAQQLAQPVSGIERQLVAAGQNHLTVVRDRSTDNVQVSAAPALITKTASDDGFQWADAGIGAGGILGLMLLGAVGAFFVRRGRHQPKSA
jgi:hypothetical protein